MKSIDRSRSMGSGRMARPVAAFMAALALGTAASAGEFGSDAYVTNGLVAHWDGIDNAIVDGVRSHSDSPTVWKDLSGNGNDLAIPATSLVAAEANAFLSLAKPDKTAGVDTTEMAALAGLSTGPDAGAFTVEVVMQNVAWKFSDNYYNLQTVADTPRGSFGYRRDKDNGFYAFFPESASKRRIWHWQPEDMTTAEVHVFSLTYGTNTATSAFFCDGEAIALSDFAMDSYSEDWGAKFAFFSNPRADVRVHAIRVYDRALTPYERDRNATLDRARFLGENASFVVRPVPDQVYDGANPCRPKPRVVDPVTELPLEEGTDYELSYADNAAPGAGTVTVTGLGERAGWAVTKEFTVTPAGALRPVEYVASTGTQCFDLGYCPNPSTRIAGDIQFVGSPANRKPVNGVKGASFFGCAEPDGVVCMTVNFGGYDFQDNQLFLWMDRSYASGADIYSWDVQNRTSRGAFEVDAASGAVSFGVQSTHAAVKTTTHSVNSLALCGSCAANGLLTPFTYYGLRVYGWKIYEGDVLVRDLAPFERITDGAAGLYDRVTGAFHVNAAGSDAFERGAYLDVSELPDGYAALDYVVATGAQSIATCVYATPGTTATVDFTPYNVSATLNRHVVGARDCAEADVPAGAFFFEAFTSLNNMRWVSRCMDAGLEDALGWNAPSSPVVAVSGTRARLTLDARGGAFYVDGTKSAALDYPMTGTSTAQISLLKAGPKASGWGRLHAAAIWQDGTLARKFIPCERKADGVAGMYDLVVGAFYPSAEGAAFLAGPGGSAGVPHLTGSYGPSCLNAGWGPSLTNFSFTVWFRDLDVGGRGLDDELYGAIVSKGALGNRTPGFCCFANASRTDSSFFKISVQTRDFDNNMLELGFDASAVRNSGRWHQLAFTHDLGRSEARLYLDGRLVDSADGAENFVNPATDWYSLRIGGHCVGGFSVKGTLSQVTLWDRALTPGEVARHCGRPPEGTESGLLGWWPLDAGSDGLRDGVANGNAVHDLSVVGDVGFSVLDEVRWLHLGTLIQFR